ncbi:MAG: lysostaphin resistance A-like protein [Saprospiraceae bacterium]
MNLSKLSHHIPLPLQIITLGFLITVCYLLGVTIIAGTFRSMDIDIQSIIQSGDINVMMEHRAAMRMLQGGANLFMFLVPGIIFTHLLYKRNWIGSVFGDKFGKPLLYPIAFLITLASIPLVAMSYHLNKSIPLPSWMLEMEESTNLALSSLLQMDSPLELMIVLLVTSLIPAIGEEWIFRGILQPRFQILLKNKHLAIWVTAILFSTIHGQFQGFIPRMLLGALLGYVMMWSGSLWLAIFVHFINNASQVIAYYFMQMGEGDIDITNTSKINWTQGILSLIVVTGMIYLFYFVANKHKNKEKHEG